jgi:hypothetical protein
MDLDVRNEKNSEMIIFESLSNTFQASADFWGSWSCIEKWLEFNTKQQV